MEQGYSETAFRLLGRSGKTALAAMLLHSGLLERLRKADPLNLLTPWRILRYEQIIDPESSVFPIPAHRFVRPRTFRKQLRYLHDNCSVLALDELCSLVAQKKPLPEKPVAITIDGGWIDTHRTAYPYLCELKLPATVFLPTAFIGTDELFWEDKVAVGLSLLRAARKPLPELSSFDEETRKDLTALGSGGLNEAVIGAVVTLLSLSMPDKRALALKQIGQAVDTIGGFYGERTFMTWAEAQEIQGLVTFGSLGHSSNLMSELSWEESAAELHASYAYLHQYLASPSRIFAFIRGATAPYSALLLKKVGIPYAVTVGITPQPTTAEESLVFGRVPISEDVSSAVGTFASRLWGVRFLGVQY